MLQGVKVATLLGLLLSTVAAQDGFEQQLLEALSQSDVLATETKLNIDDRPSTITVLHREQLTRMGFMTLHDALGMLPGIEQSRSTNGWRTVTVRGAHNPNGFGFDKVKLLIDGVDVTSDLYGTVYYYLDFPVELIERIEVLRGPASVEYGTGGYAGAINVITRLQEGHSQLFLQGGDERYRAAGAVFNHQGDRWRIGVDAYHRSDEASVFYPDPDRGSTHTYSGTSYQGFTDRAAGLLITDGQFYLKGRTKDAAYDNHTGGTASPVADNSDKNNNTHHLLEVGYRAPAIDGFRWGIKAGVRAYTYDMRLRAYTPDQVRAITMSDLNDLEPIGAGYVQLLIEQGLSEEDALARWESSARPALLEAIDHNLTDYGIANFYAQEQAHYAQLDLHYDGWNGHHLHLGAAIEQSSNRRSHIDTNYLTEEIGATGEKVLENDLLALAGGEPQPIDADWGATKRLVDDRGFISSARHSRQISSLWAIHTAQITPALDLMAGLRADHYDDLERTLPSYQIGALYRASATNRFKAMAGRAFRAPSRMELYSLGARGLVPLGNDDLEPETIDTLQVGWHRRLSGQGMMEATLFHSTLRDVIDINTTGDDRYDNYPKRTARGFEFGWHQRVEQNHRFQASFTYLDVRHHGHKQPSYSRDQSYLHDIATIMGNLAHTWYIDERWSLNSHAQLHAGRVQNSSDQPMDDNLILNETLSFQIDPQRRWQLHLHNLFDSARTTASNGGRHASGSPMPGRRIYMGYTQRF